MTQAIKFCPCPVVVAPFGLALGGGAEVTLHAAVAPAASRALHGAGRNRGRADSCGRRLQGDDFARRRNCRGGCTHSIARRLGRAASRDAHHLRNLALAKVSTSAFEARGLRLLRPSDAITMNRDRVLHDAQSRAVALAEAGLPRAASGHRYSRAGRKRPRGARARRSHDAAGRIRQRPRCDGGSHLAKSCAGATSPRARLSASNICSILSASIFFPSAAKRKSQERIAFTLKTGKPLRN